MHKTSEPRGVHLCTQWLIHNGVSVCSLVRTDMWRISLRAMAISSFQHLLIRRALNLQHTTHNEPLWLDWISGETNMTICKIKKWSDNCLSKWAKTLVQGQVEDIPALVLLYFFIKSKKLLEPWPSCSRHIKSWYSSRRAFESCLHNVLMVPFLKKIWLNKVQNATGNE